MCFISDLIEIAYQQDSAIPGYVQDDSVVMLADAIEAAIVAADELVKISYPLFNDIVRDEDGDWLVISSTNALLGIAPTIVRARLLSNKNPHNKADLAKPYQIRMFNVADLRPIRGDRANWIKDIVEVDPELLRNEIPMGSHEHIRSYVDVYINADWRAFFVNGQIIYKDKDGCPPIDVEVRHAVTHTAGKKQWANPTAQPFKFENLPWYKEVTKSR